MVSLPRSFSKLRRVDLLVLLAAVLLMALGVMLVRSASTDAPLPFHHSQIKWLLISLAAAVPCILIPYTRILSWAPSIFFFGLLLLALVPIVGPTVNGARRWLTFGGVSVQPSEFMKLVTVLFLARMLRFGRPLKSLRTQMRPLFVILLPMLLTLVQPDLGTSMLFVPVALAVLLVSGASFRTLGLLCLVGAVCVGLAYGFVLKPYQKERIKNTFAHSKLTRTQAVGGGYQLNQSLMTIGNGGLLGHGHLKGPRTQSGRLPYRHNDFIFAVLGEEHGFLGASFVLLLVLILAGRVFSVARRSRDPAGRMLCVGVGTLFCVQALIHAGVTLGLVPTTGMPFPFLSHGGSSLLTYTVGLALVLNVSVHRPPVPIRLRQREEQALLLS